MRSRPVLIGSIVTQDAMRICSRCWHTLATTPSPFRHSLTRTFMRMRTSITITKGKSVWGNNSIRADLAPSERIWSPRRELRSSMIAMRLGTMRQSVKDEVGVASQETLLGRGSIGSKGQDSETVQNMYPIALDASAQLATISSNLPQRSLKRVLTTYLSLSKPRLSFLVVLTATATYSLYPVPELLAPAATSMASLSTLTLLFLTSGTALCSASANALNMLMEPKYDAKMSRTRNRPLVRKLVSRTRAAVFAVVCGVAGVGALYFGVNSTTAFLGGANILLYAGVYTPMKRISVLNTWIGAIVGGIPPLMGWTAAASQYASDGTWEELLFSKSSVGGWSCAALLFAWQFPHFNSLSWSIREEYKHAGYRMLAWVNPAQNGRVALRYAMLMFPICVGLSYCGVTDWSFVATSSAVNGWMLLKAYQFWITDGYKGTARGLFWASVWHLPIVMVLAMAQKKGLWERFYRSLFGYPGGDGRDSYTDAGDFAQNRKKIL